MSDDLLNIYTKAGLAHRFFDDKTPRDLYRAQSFRDAKRNEPKIYPNEGFQPKEGDYREPDVETFERDGEKWVRGCRTIRGDYRGVSMFDRISPKYKGGTWYVLAKDTGIPETLAILQDDAITKDRSAHFTIAPKDDMTKGLFQVWLNALGDKLTKATG